MERVSFIRTLGFGGAIMAYCMGAGFATGQEALQFFASHGYLGLAGVVLAAGIFIFYCAHVMAVGRRLRLQDPQQIFQVFCGRFTGKVMRWFSLVLLFCIFIVMLSAAGAVTQDHTGASPWVGSAGMAVVCMISMFIGFNALVNILKIKGPLIILVCVSVCVVACLAHLNNFDANASAIVSMDLPRVSAYWWLAAILYPCFITIPMTTFLVRLGAKAASARQAATGGALGAGVFFICMLVVAMGLIADPNALHKEVPVLYLADTVSPLVSDVFAVLLFIGIYTTAASILWAVCLNFDAREARVFKCAAVVLSAIAFACALFPFGTLVGFIFPLSGWLGIAYLLMMIGSALRRNESTWVAMSAANPRT